MNFVVICLHCLDMRDFHSNLRDTPFLDWLRNNSVFIPMGRAQGHNQVDSIIAEMTGKWTARFSDSELTKRRFRKGKNLTPLSKTLIEYMQENDYEIFTKIKWETAAINCGLKNVWMANEPERLKQFWMPDGATREEIIDKAKGSKKFYLHVFIRDTHRPWGQQEELCAMVGKPPAGEDYIKEVHCSRRAALEHADEFAALRRRGLAKADRIVEKIYQEFKDRDDVTFIVYSNHGEVFDHYRYYMEYPIDTDGNILGTSHGAYPYEVVYANMQMWKIPGQTPKVMKGIGRLIDFAPTILDLANIKAKDMDGKSMLKHFKNGVFPDCERYAENTSCMSMVRKDGYKVISTIDIPCHNIAVFDLKSDPYEYVNLIDTPKGEELLNWAIEKHKLLKKKQGFFDKIIGDRLQT